MKALRYTIFGNCFWICSCIGLLLLSGCSTTSRMNTSAETLKPVLSSITLVDKNGVTETVAEKQRLIEFERSDFFAPQPYQKVLRVYSRSADGKIRSKLSTYHDNGSIKQYLEIYNGRAMGAYMEWFSSGQLRMSATVIEGKPEVDPFSQETWSFDGESKVYAEDGSLEATLMYRLGALDGESKQYFPSGAIERISSFKKGLQVGQEQTFFPSGQQKQIRHFDEGKLQGESMSWYDNGKEWSKEEWQQGLLMEGAYYNQGGSKVAEVLKGNGKKALFHKGYVAELIEIRHGVEEGEVTLYASNGDVTATYYQKTSLQKTSLKHGLETRYYPKTEPPRPKMTIDWQEGLISGTVKTWYPNGVLESQREFISNSKQGIAMAWYIDGGIMLIEEYEKDRLSRGEYRKRGDSHPVSQIIDGKGFATLFDSKGALIKKVRYIDGVPQNE